MRSIIAAQSMLFIRIGMLVLGLSICIYLVIQYMPSMEMLGERVELAVWPHGIFALGLFLLHILLVFWAWHYSLDMVGVKVPPKLSIGIYISSLVTRYIPGGIWHLGSRLLALSRLGKNPYLVGVTLFIEQAAAFVVCLLLVILFVVLSSVYYPELLAVTDNMVGKKMGWLAVFGMGSLVLLYPAVFQRILACVFKLIKGKKLSISLSARGLHELYGIHALSLLVFAYAYYQILITIAGDGVPAVIVIFVVLLATVLGYLTPFVPGGIGVRESLIVLLMSSFTGVADATAMAVLGRISIVLVELLLLFLVALSFGVAADAE